MHMRPILLLTLIATLAACGTPRQMCEATATKDLRVVNKLVADTELNIARGYGIVQVPSVRTGLQLCAGGGDEPFLFCSTQDVTMQNKPVALDLNAERAKLASLRQKQAELNAFAAARLGQCQAQYPAG